MGQSFRQPIIPLYHIEDCWIFTLVFAYGLKSSNWLDTEMNIDRVICFQKVTKSFLRQIFAGLPLELTLTSYGLFSKAL